MYLDEEARGLIASLFSVDFKSKIVRCLSRSLLPKTLSGEAAVLSPLSLPSEINALLNLADQGYPELVLALLKKLLPGESLSETLLSGDLLVPSLLTHNCYQDSPLATAYIDGDTNLSMPQYSRLSSWINFTAISSNLNPASGTSALLTASRMISTTGLSPFPFFFASSVVPINVNRPLALIIRVNPVTNPAPVYNPLGNRFDQISTLQSDVLIQIRSSEPTKGIIARFRVRARLVSTVRIATQVLFLGSPASSSALVGNANSRLLTYEPDSAMRNSNLTRNMAGPPVTDAMTFEVTSSLPVQVEIANASSLLLSKFQSSLESFTQ